MKLVILIPCLNEEATLAQTPADLPDTIAGIDEISTLLIDDCSTDSSVSLAREAGISEVITLKHQRGLSYVLRTGVDAALERGADLILIADADNQYRGEDAARLVEPLLAGEADVVIGERPIEQIKSYSPLKKLLQRFGSNLVSNWFGVNVPDAASGFRAFTREAALSLNLRASYTYTIEALVQWADHDFRLLSVPVRTNPVERPSRLVKSSFDYTRRQAVIILRLYLEYRPFHFFSVPGGLSITAGLFFWVRFLVFYLSGSGQGNVQSLVVGSALVLIGFLLFVTACLAHLIASNRKTLERNYRDTRRQRFFQIRDK